MNFLRNLLLGLGVLALPGVALADSAEWFDVKAASLIETVAACEATAVVTPTAQLAENGQGLNPGDTKAWCATNTDSDSSAIIEVVRKATLIFVQDYLQAAGVAEIYIIKCIYPTKNAQGCTKLLLDVDGNGVINSTDDVALDGDGGSTDANGRFVYNLERGFYYFNFCTVGTGSCNGNTGTIPGAADLTLVSLEGNE